MANIKRLTTDKSNRKLSVGSDSVLDAATSDAWMLGDQYTSLTVTPTTTAKVQYTHSSESEIIADTAVWHDWEYGEIETEIGTTCNSISAIRLVSIAGAATMQMSSYRDEV